MPDKEIIQEVIEESLDVAYRSREERVKTRNKIKNFAYYSRPYANAIKVVIDKMIADKLPRAFDAVKHRKNVRTLYYSLTRGLYYLTDFMDTPENTYEKFQRATMFSMDFEKKVVRLKYKECDGSFSPNVKQYVAPVWRGPFDTFIEEGESGSEINISELKLSKDDMEYIAGNLLGLEEIVQVIKFDMNNIVMRKK